MSVLTVASWPAVLLYLTVHTVHWSQGRQGMSLRHRETQGATGTADTFILSWLARQPQHSLYPGWPSSHSSTYAVFSPLLAGPTNTAVIKEQFPPLYGWSSYRGTPQSIPQPSKYLMTHTQCYKWSQLLHSHYLENVGQESLNMPSWPISSLPTPAYRFPCICGYLFLCKVVWYSHLFHNFPVCCDPQSQWL